MRKTDQNELISHKHESTCCMDLNYIEHVLILASAVTGYVSVSAFASLVGICIEITSSAIGLNICAIILKIKKYKSIIKKKKKKHGKMVLLAKTN